MSIIASFAYPGHSDDTTCAGLYLHQRKGAAENDAHRLGRYACHKYHAPVNTRRNTAYRIGIGGVQFTAVL